MSKTPIYDRLAANWTDATRSAEARGIIQGQQQVLNLIKDETLVATIREQLNMKPKRTRTKKETK